MTEPPQAGQPLADRPLADRPLAGHRVVVTRARDSAPDLSRRLEELGATVVELPVVAVAPPADGGRALDRAADRLTAGAYAWVAFTSASGVRALAETWGDRAAPDGLRWAAVGPGTARALAGCGLPVDLVASTSSAAGLADAFPRPETSSGPDAAPLAVLFPRAETVRGDLAAGLRAAGWQVDEVVAYRTVAGAPDPAQVAAAVRADAVAFTSSSTVERTVEVLGRSGVPPVVVTIGPSTSTTAAAAGLTVAAQADPHSLDGLVAAVTAALAGRGPGRGPGPGPGRDLGAGPPPDGGPGGLP